MNISENAVKYIKLDYNLKYKMNHSLNDAVSKMDEVFSNQEIRI